MSRIRIIKGKSTEIVEEDYQIFSTSDIVYSSATEIIEIGVEKGVSYGVPEYPPLAPQPIKIMVQFRPHKSWKGEFGFDWYRLGDTTLFRDYAFKDIVAYQYLDYKHTMLVDISKSEYINKNDGYFKADETMLMELQKQYKPYTIPWKATKNKKTGKAITEEYYIPWLSLLKDKEAKVTFFAEIPQEADYLEFAPTDYFTFSPGRIDIKGKKKIALNDVEITIKCIKEFTTDQTLELEAYKKDKDTTIEAIAGKLNVWANDITKQKTKDVVFVAIVTPNLLGGIKPNKPNIIDEKERINNYLVQAYIQLSGHSDIVELDLTTDKDFHHFITNNAIDRKKTFNYRSLEVHLKEKLEEQYPKKYNKHFKAFYFAEMGYEGPLSNLNGYSAEGADFVVAFSNKDDQTAAHEFLHSFGIAHTFTNKYTDANALFTFYYQTTDNLMDYVDASDRNKRVSLYYWQWKIANASIK